MALGLAKNDDILPWTDDTFPRSNYAEMLAAPSPTATPGADTPVSTPAVVSPALQPPAPEIERVPSTPAPADNPLKTQKLTPERRREIIQANAPKMADDPIGAIGFLFQSIAAGMQGKELPAERLVKQHREQEALQLQRATVGIQLLEHAQKVLKKTPAEKRAEVIKQFGAEYGTIAPGIEKQLAAMSGGAITPQQLEVLGEHAPTLLAAAGGDFDEALKLSTNSSYVKMLNERTDTRNQAIIPAKIGQLQTVIEKKIAAGDTELANYVAAFPKSGTGSTMVPFGTLVQINSQLPKQFQLSGGELRTLRDNPGIAIQNGIQPPEVALKMAEAEATGANTSPLAKLQKDYKLAVSRGDGPAAQQLRQEINKQLRDDAGQTLVTLVGPQGDEVTLRKGDKQVDALIGKDYVERSADNSQVKPYLTPNGTMIAATPRVARQRGYLPVVNATTIETVGPDGKPVKTTVGPMGWNGAIGRLDEIGASGRPMIVGEIQPSEVEAATTPTTAGATPAGDAAEGTPAAEAAPGSLAATPGGGGAPKTPLAAQAAGAAAVAVQPKEPGVTVTRTDVGKSFEKPGEPLPKHVQENLSQYKIALQGIAVMKDSRDLVGQDTTGMATWLLTKVNPGDKLNATRENKLAAAIDGYRVASQSLIKGVPSNKDQDILNLTIPGILNSQQTYDARVAQAENITKQLVADQIAYYKHTGVKIPKEIVEDFKQFGIDPSKVNAWNGKGNPYEKSMKTAFESMPDADLLKLSQDVRAGKRQVEPDSLQQLRTELLRRAGTKK